jgi:hypothetical protein
LFVIMTGIPVVNVVKANNAQDGLFKIGQLIMIRYTFVLLPRTRLNANKGHIDK